LPSPDLKGLRVVDHLCEEAALRAMKSQQQQQQRLKAMPNIAVSLTWFWFLHPLPLDVGPHEHKSRSGRREATLLHTWPVRRHPNGRPSHPSPNAGHSATRR